MVGSSASLRGGVRGSIPSLRLEAYSIGRDDYKIGRRNNPIMKGFAGQLSKQEIEDLAAWFSSQKSNLHDQR